MKKINKEEIKEISNILKDIKYNPGEKEANIFFPIETERNEESDGFEWSVKNTDIGSKKEFIPGLILRSKNDLTTVELAYARTDYCPKFDCLQYMDIVGGKQSKSLKEFLSEHECYLVNQDYIIATFRLFK